MKCASQIRLSSLGRLSLAAALMLAMLGSASAGGKRKMQDAPKIDTSKLVWPPPPDQPRIRFTSQVTGELDLLGKVQNTKASMLERMAGVSIAPEERPKLKKPYGVAVDSKGRIYVADSTQNEVFVFDVENKKLEFRGNKSPANLQVPIGVAVDDRDRLFVSDSLAHQVTCFEVNGDVAGVFGAAELKRPAGLVADTDLRRLYVADSGGARIAVFDLDTFKLLRYFGDVKNDEGVKVLTSPNGVASDPDGQLYVTDAIGARITILDPDGNFVRTFGKRGDGPGMFARPKGIAFDSDGHVYVADAQLNRVQAFTPTGEPLIVWGRFGYGPGEFTSVAGLAIDKKNNRLVTVDQMPGRVQIFRYITDAETAANTPAASKDKAAGAAKTEAAQKASSPK
jgi:DNA-binding beta-propeller fold protein YncE